MAKKKADVKTVRLIYKLAGDPTQVKQSQTSYWDLVSYKLTKAGLCQAIQDWIDEGKDVVEDITTKAKSHIGKAHYIMKPTVEKQKIFLKVGIEKNPDTNEYMMIISSHK